MKGTKDRLIQLLIKTNASLADSGIGEEDILDLVELNELGLMWRNRNMRKRKTELFR